MLTRECLRKKKENKRVCSEKEKEQHLAPFDLAFPSSKIKKNPKIEIILTQETLTS